jgi:hypothetical protein
MICLLQIVTYSDAAKGKFYPMIDLTQLRGRTYALPARANGHSIRTYLVEREILLVQELLLQTKPSC